MVVVSTKLQSIYWNYAGAWSSFTVKTTLVKALVIVIQQLPHALCAYLPLRQIILPPHLVDSLPLPVVSLPAAEPVLSLDRWERLSFH